MTNRKREHLLLGLALAALVFPTTAQAADADSSGDSFISREEFNGLRADLQTLRDDWTRTYQLKTPNTTRSLSLGGTLQERYTIYEDGKTPSFFTTPFASLTLTGNLYKDYLEGHNLDYSVGYNAAKATLNDANLKYAIFSSTDTEGPQLSATLGQQLVPFGLEAQVQDNVKPTINNALFMTNYGFGRDVGVQLKGDILANNDYGNNYRVALLQYQLAVLNGNGANTSADTNTDKDYVGRLVLNYTGDYNSTLRGLALGASIYQGSKFNSVNAYPTGQGGSVKVTNTAGTVVTVPVPTATPIVQSGNYEVQRVGADLSYVNVPFGFTAEIIESKEQTETAVLANKGQKIYIARDGTLNTRASTVTLFYEFGEQFLTDYRNQTRSDDWWPTTYQFFVRGDLWDPNTLQDNDEQYVGTAGFNLFFAQTTKLQINYLAKQNEGDPYGLHGSEWDFQFQYGF
jgi:hypothetical protein